MNFDGITEPAEDSNTNEPEKNDIKKAHDDMDTSSTTTASKRYKRKGEKL